MIYIKPKIHHTILSCPLCTPPSNQPIPWVVSSLHSHSNHPDHYLRCLPWEEFLCACAQVQLYSYLCIDACTFVCVYIGRQKASKKSWPPPNQIPWENHSFTPCFSYNFRCLNEVENAIRHLKSCHTQWLLEAGLQCHVQHALECLM